MHDLVRAVFLDEVTTAFNLLMWHILCTGYTVIKLTLYPLSHRVVVCESAEKRLLPGRKEVPGESLCFERLVWHSRHMAGHGSWPHLEFLFRERGAVAAGNIGG